MSETIRVEDVVPPPLTESLPRPQPGSLLGRDQKMALIINEFLYCAASGGDAMLLIGEPGVGQKMLLDVDADPAMAYEVWVLRTVEGTRVVDLKPSAHTLTFPHPRLQIGRAHV